MSYWSKRTSHSGIVTLLSFCITQLGISNTTYGDEAVGESGRLLDPTMSVRVARPTNDLVAIRRFYVDAVGLKKVGEFRDHEGFDGLMLGIAGATWHLEFTSSEHHVAPRAPSEDNLVVLYIPSEVEYKGSIRRMIDHGYSPVKSLNPYWDRVGTTFEDHDGYRIVFSRQSWTNK